MAKHRSERLTTAIKNIFGWDLVEDVWAILPDDIPGLMTYTQEMLDKRKPQMWENGLGVEYNSTDVVIVFKNGNKVSFEASEWASMQRA